MYSSIDERVDKIRGNDKEINNLIEEYKPFIASCTQKATGKYVHFGEDDELSIAMMAFAEAVECYKSDKGGFLAFAGAVIKRRLIDYFRKEQRHCRVISINEYLNNDQDEIDLTINKAIDRFSVEETARYRRMEIEELKDELQRWGITFLDLVNEAPGQVRTRKYCKKIIKFLISQPELVELIKKKRYLPVSIIEKSLGISRKKIERMRRYIIAAMLISTGDYLYLRDYIHF